jgi:hypothetical protein
VADSLLKHSNYSRRQANFHTDFPWDRELNWTQWRRGLPRLALPEIVILIDFQDVLPVV